MARVSEAPSLNRNLGCGAAVRRENSPASVRMIVCIVAANEGIRVCVCVCVHACVRACVRACIWRGGEV